MVACQELVAEVETSSNAFSKRFKDLTHDISMAQKAKKQQRAESMHSVQSPISGATADVSGEIP